MQSYGSPIAGSIEVPKEHQGQQANRNGSATERDIHNRLRDHGYIRRKAIDPTETAPYFVQQCRQFLSMVGAPWKIDFYIWHPIKWPMGLVLESKYQDGGGSVDEKLPFTVLSLKATGLPCRLLLQGSGARIGFTSWCRAQQNEQFRVFSWDDFVAAMNKGLL